MFENTKSLPITVEQVWAAYLEVRKHGKAAGVDKLTLQEYATDKSDQLYKVWNRMASGSYFPPPVRRVEIPKTDGKKRNLGIPTVNDRVAQMVVKSYLEPLLEPHFHENSFGYRPNKKAHDAVRQAAEQCRQKAWVLDLDIEGFFDNLDHDKLMQAVQKHTNEKWVLMYVERWLKAPIEHVDGRLEYPTKGTPQGGVIALRTHLQTLSFSEGLKLREGSSDYIIKGIIFMVNGKITELGIGQTDQSCLHDAAKGHCSTANRREVDSEVWGIADTGLSLCKPGKSDQRENGDPGKFCSIYRQTTTLTDQAHQEVIRCSGSDDQQSGPYCAGRIFSKAGSCQERRNKLRYPLSMTVCGSRNSLRSTISLYRSTSPLFSLKRIVMN